MDGAGDGLCASANIIENGKLNRVSGSKADISPGRFYSEVTGFVGFKRLRHEGKITGLAAYGDSNRFYADFKKFLRFNKETEEFEFDMPERSPLASKWKTFNRVVAGIQTARPHIAEFNDYLSKHADPKDDMKDLAAAAQRILEEIAVEYVQFFLEKYPNKNVLLAGGIFANVRVNQLIGEIPGVEFIYIHQNMGDGGLSLGAAMRHYYEDMGNTYNGYQPNHVYFGHAFTDDQIEAALKERGLDYDKHENVEAEIAKLIHDGKVLGRFNGGMEYGPRALGNRSIIAQTTDRTINDWLNKKLNRTEFMPFAPSVYGPEAKAVLENYENGSAQFADNFMTITYYVKPEWRERMQAATHVDGTARPQVVWEKNNSSYFKILEEYFKLSGIPAIINTSFNMHEEPIVRTPQDAIRSFDQGCLDYLAIGSFLVKFK
jgi:carbamoyltransferase